jgi:uncharacterized membrane protein
MPQAFTTYFIPFGIPVISILVAVPLVMQKVPQNYWYGFRTRKTLSDSTIWYRANYLGGVNLLYAGVIAVCINGVLAVTLHGTLLMLAGSLVTLITTMIALLISMKRLREL